MKEQQIIGTKIKYSLSCQDYRTIYWESETLNFNGKQVKFIARMQYHTFLKFWTCSISFCYGKDFIYGHSIIGKDYLSKKNARKLLFNLVNKVSLKDLDKIEDSDFYKKEIIENGIEYASSTIINRPGEPNGKVYK